MPAQTPPPASTVGPEIFTMITSRPGAIRSFATPSTSASKDCGSVPWTTVQPVPSWPFETAESGMTVAHGPGAASAEPAQTRSAPTAAIPTRIGLRALLVTDRVCAFRALFPRGEIVERSKPAQALFVGHGGVRGGGRRKDEEVRLAQAALSQAVLGPLAKRAVVGRLADEGDDGRREVRRQTLEPLRRPGEVRTAQFTAPLRRPVGGIREPEPEVGQRPLLIGRVQTRREPRLVEEPPEVVPRVGEVRRRGCRAKAGVDPTED